MHVVVTQCTLLAGVIIGGLFPLASLHTWFVRSSPDDPDLLWPWAKRWARNGALLVVFVTVAIFLFFSPSVGGGSVEIVACNQAVSAGNLPACIVPVW